MTKQALLAARETLQHASIFVRTREKMHPTGVELYDETLALIDAALAQPEWAMPEPEIEPVPTCSPAGYTADQMRAAFEAGRMAG